MVVEYILGFSCGSSNSSWASCVGYSGCDVKDLDFPRYFGVEFGGHWLFLLMDGFGFFALLRWSMVLWSWVSGTFWVSGWFLPKGSIILVVSVINLLASSSRPVVPWVVSALVLGSFPTIAASSSSSALLNIVAAPRVVLKLHWFLREFLLGIELL